MSHFIVMLGPPGAGKGTQAGFLARAFDVPHVSSGELFRDHLGRRTELGLLAKEYMDRGGLVPDDVTVRMVVDRIGQRDCGNGVVLDGFPRTLSQVVALEAALAERGREVTAVPLIQVSDEEVVNRLAARRTCRDCGAVYNRLFNPPCVPEVCDVCGGDLSQRADDKPETVRNRLYTYYKETGPLVGYYFARGLLVEVDGQQEIDKVRTDLREGVEAAGNGR